MPDAEEAFTELLTPASWEEPSFTAQTRRIWPLFWDWRIMRDGDVVMGATTPTWTRWGARRAARRAVAGLENPVGPTWEEVNL